MALIGFAALIGLLPGPYPPSIFPGITAEVLTGMRPVTQ